MAFDTDDGSCFLNATSNVLYEAKLWKTDFGGHTKSYHNNVVINGDCSGTNGKSPKWERESHDSYVAQQCINSGKSHVDDCDRDTKFDVHDNRYYVDGGDGSPVCANKSSPLERGSKVMPLPDDDFTIKLAKKALGMNPDRESLVQLV